MGRCCSARKEKIMGARDVRPVRVYLRTEGQEEQLEAVFYNERYGFSAYEMARRFARWRTPGGFPAKRSGWHWRLEREEKP